MKDVMKTGAAGQLETVGHFIDDSSDAVRPVEAGPKFALGDAMEGGWGAVA